MTAPLVSPEVDLRGLEYMPLFGNHLFGSEFNAAASDEEWRAALTLWWAAWNQVPAGSLPNNDQALCRLADLGREVKAWMRVKARALHGFIECDDGRLYHSFICKQALVAWEKRVKERERKANWRTKKAGRDADVPRDRTGTETGHDADVPADGTGRDVTGRDVTGIEPSAIAPGSTPPDAIASVATASAKPPPRKARREGESPPTATTWAAYSQAYERRYGQPPVRNAQVNGQLANLVSKLGQEAPGVAEFYVGHQGALYVRSMHDVALLLRDATGLRTQWATGRRVMSRDAGEADRIAADGGMWGRIRSETKEAVDG